MSAPGWIITTTAAFCSLTYNFIFWPWDLPEKEKNPQQAYKEVRSSTEMVELVAKDLETQLEPRSPSAVVMHVKTDDQSPSSSHIPLGSPSNKEKSPAGEDNEMQGVSTETPTVKGSIWNCPWAVMPFVYGMFTLVSGLASAGWIAKLAQAILNVIPADEGNSAHAIAVSTFLMATISFVLCTLIDNQPASILLSQVLIDPLFDGLPVNVRRAGMLGVLEGANVGGCWSLMGALAGIMWATLLRNKGIHIGYIQFMKVGLRVMPVVTFMVALIIFAESCNAPTK